MIVTLLSVHLIAFAIWVGSLVALAVVMRTARRVFEPPQLAAFYPAVGRAYGVVGSAALVVAIVSGGVLAGSPSHWSDPVWGALAAAVVLCLVSVVAMRQARKVGRLRRAVTGGDSSLATSLATNVRATDAMRGAIALLTLVAVVCEAAAIAQR